MKEELEKSDTTLSAEKRNVGGIGVKKEKH